MFILTILEEVHHQQASYMPWLHASQQQLSSRKLIQSEGCGWTCLIFCSTLEKEIFGTNTAHRRKVQPMDTKEDILCCRREQPRSRCSSMSRLPHLPFLDLCIAHSPLLEVLSWWSVFQSHHLFLFCSLCLVTLQKLILLELEAFSSVA